MSLLQDIAKKHQVSDSQLKHFTIHATDGNLDYVLMHYDGFVSSDEFIKTSKDSMPLLNRCKSKTVIVDIETLKVMNKESQNFVKDQWFPTAMKSGIRRIGFVKPKDIFGMASMTSANNGVEQVEMQYFDTLDEAVVWAKQ